MCIPACLGMRAARQDVGRGTIPPQAGGGVVNLGVGLMSVTGTPFGIKVIACATPGMAAACFWGVGLGWPLSVRYTLF